MKENILFKVKIQQKVILHFSGKQILFSRPPRFKMLSPHFHEQMPPKYLILKS